MPNLEKIGKTKILIRIPDYTIRLDPDPKKTIGSAKHFNELQRIDDRVLVLKETWSLLPGNLYTAAIRSRTKMHFFSLINFYLFHPLLELRVYVNTHFYSSNLPLLYTTGLSLRMKQKMIVSTL